jgi:hypothetical protein
MFNLLLELKCAFTILEKADIFTVGILNGNLLSAEILKI